MNAKDAWLKQVKYHKKRLKGLPRCGLNPCAGNVEHNIEMFNNMNRGTPILANPMNGTIGDGAGMSMGEAYTQSFHKLSPEFKLFIEEHIGYIENNDFEAL